MHTNDHRIGVWETSKVNVYSCECYRHVRPFCLYHGAFDCHMFDLMIVISFLSLVLEISIRAFGNWVECAMFREIVVLLQRVTLEVGWW
jgi:hypothetical protein